MARKSLPLKVGDVFGRLTVLERVPNNARGDVRWACRCVCGTERVVAQNNLRNGNTTSCGCYHKERLKVQTKTHGQKGTRLYRIWQHIITRCTNHKAKDFKDYGGRRITVYAAWQHSFSAFADYVATHLGPQPTPQHTIDRIDNESGNYEPGDLRWATRFEQSRNTRANVRLTYNGETRVLNDWATHLGVHRTTLSSRLRLGWSVERTLTEPVHKKGS
jgi:hypothetical protein